MSIQLLMKIIILIPAYNEKGNLEILIKSIENQFQKLKINFKIFFVLQGDDGSRELLTKLKKTNSRLDFIHFKNPLGIGRAYKIGYSKVDKNADYILTLDADLNHDISEFPKFLKSIRDGKFDLVIGSRFVAGGRFNDKRIWKKKISLLANMLIAKIISIKVKDISSGYRLIKRKVVEKVQNKLQFTGYPSYMEFILYTHKFGFKIKEIPITYHPRLWGKSKISSFKTMFDYFHFLIAVLFNF